jgi:hypothetical protein
MPTVTIQCPSCKARIKAPTQLLGQRRRCPGCDAHFLVQPKPPQDEGPALVRPEVPTAYPIAR